jgi:hypothetical protein
MDRSRTAILTDLYLVRARRDTHRAELAHESATAEGAQPVATLVGYVQADLDHLDWLLDEYLGYLAVATVRIPDSVAELESANHA